MGARVGGLYNTPIFDPVDTTRIRGLSKLPAPVNGIITPATINTFLETKIDLKDFQFNLPANSALTGYTALVSRFVGTNAEALVKANFPNPSVAGINDIGFENTGGGSGLKIDGGAIVGCENVIFTGSGIDLRNFIALNIISGLFENDAGVIFNTTAVNSRSTLLRCGFFQESAVNSIEVATGVNIGILNISGTTFDTFAGGVGIALIDNDMQVGSGSLVSGPFLGAGNLYLNFDEKSNAWSVLNVFGTPESCDQGITKAVNNSGTTVALTQGIWSPISDGGISLVYSQVGSPQKFTIADTNTGKQTYNGVRARCYKVSAPTSFKAASGTNITVEIGVSVNGNSPAAGTIVSAVVSNTTRVPLTLPSIPVDLNPADTIELMTRNITNDNDVDFFESELSVFF